MLVTFGGEGAGRWHVDRFRNIGRTRCITRENFAFGTLTGKNNFRGSIVKSSRTVRAGGTATYRLQRRANGFPKSSRKVLDDQLRHVRLVARLCSVRRLKLPTRPSARWRRHRRRHRWTWWKVQRCCRMWDFHEFSGWQKGLRTISIQLIGDISVASRK